MTYFSNMSCSTSFILDSSEHNESLKCDRLKFQKDRKKPESCHPFHPEVKVLDIFFFFNPLTEKHFLLYMYLTKVCHNNFWGFCSNFKMILKLQEKDLNHVTKALLSHAQVHICRFTAALSILNMRLMLCDISYHKYHKMSPIGKCHGVWFRNPPLQPTNSSSAARDSSSRQQVTVNIPAGQHPELTQ